MIRLLLRGFATRGYRSTESMVLVVAEGRGEIAVAGRRFEVGEKDVFVNPGWTSSRICAMEELVLCSFSDRVVQEKLGLFRAQRSSAPCEPM